MSDTIQKVPPTRSGGRSQNPRRTQTVKIKASWLDERGKSSFKCSLIVNIQVTFLIHIGFMSYVYVICDIIFHIVNTYYIIVVFFFYESCYKKCFYSKRNPPFIVSGWELLPLHFAHGCRCCIRKQRTLNWESRRRKKKTLRNYKTFNMNLCSIF